MVVVPVATGTALSWLARFCHAHVEHAAQATDASSPTATSHCSPFHGGGSGALALLGFGSVSSDMSAQSVRGQSVRVLHWESELLEQALRECSLGSLAQARRTGALSFASRHQSSLPRLI